MIISKEEEIKVQSNFETEGYDAKISEEDLHKLWSMLQDPYRNPIGAVVREYTSNCFDSHSEAGVSDAVHVKIDKDDTGNYWSCEDFGVGLSPDRIQNVFVSYLKSTKENTNNQIGAFGLGSKSGLSYTNVVHIRTRYNGIEYLYLLLKGEKTPRLEKLFESPTEERNGTQIKIYIKEVKKYYGRIEPEVSNFKKECERQLCYFDNIYFDNCGVNNDYKIIEGKHWKYNNLIKPFSSLHIVLCKVPYPINWDELGIDEIHLQVGLKFEIGELDIIQTREDVKYTPRTVEAIKNKINLLKEEFKEIWNKNNFELEDIVEYKRKIYEGTYYIDFENCSFNLKDLFSRAEISFLPYFKFKPLINFKGTIPSEPFFAYEVTKRLSNNCRIVPVKWSRVYDTISDNNLLYRLKVPNTQPIKNKYIQSLDPNKSIYFLEKKHIPLVSYVRILNLNPLDKREKIVQIKLYQNAIAKQILDKTKSYDLTEVDPEFNKKIKETKERKKLEKGTIVSRRFFGSSWDREEINLDKGLPGCIIVGTKDDEDTLKVLWKLFKKSFKSTRYLNVISVAKSNVKSILELKNVWTIQSIMSEKSKPFMRAVTAYKISEEYRFVKDIDYEKYINIYTPISQDVKEIQKIIEVVRNWGGELESFIRNNCMYIAEESNLFDQELLNKANRIKNYFEGLELLNFVQDKEEWDPIKEEYIEVFPTLEVARYIYNYNRIIKNKKKFKKLNAYYYCNFNQEELKWLEGNKEEYKFQKFKQELK